MRTLILLTGALALAACAQEAAEVDEEAVVEEEVAEVDPVVGAYTWTEDDGQEVTGYINADGTAYQEVGGERMDTANWVRNESDQVCFQSTDAETGESGEDCMTFGEVAEDGTVEVTGADGETETVVKIS